MNKQTNKQHTAKQSRFLHKIHIKRLKLASFAAHTNHCVPKNRFVYRLLRQNVCISEIVC